jgi:hypothetical protein
MGGFGKGGVFWQRFKSKKIRFAKELFRIPGGGRAEGKLMFIDAIRHRIARLGDG